MLLGRALTWYAQFWLLGYEFPTTLMLILLDTIYIVTTAKKGQLLFSAPTHVIWPISLLTQRS